jgi:hypothetical protein
MKIGRIGNAVLSIAQQEYSRFSSTWHKYLFLTTIADVNGNEVLLRRSIVVVISGRKIGTNNCKLPKENWQ